MASKPQASAASHLACSVLPGSSCSWTASLTRHPRHVDVESVRAADTLSLIPGG